MQGGATGTGTVTLLAPSTSINRTLTLPDVTGTVTTSEAVTAAGYTTPAAVLTQFNASGSAPVYACRAWVNFNGIGTVAIRASGNVSSITDNGVGNFRVNFATPMPDANYCPLAWDSGWGIGWTDAPISTSSYVLKAANNGGTLIDPEYVFSAVFR